MGGVVVRFGAFDVLLGAMDGILAALNVGVGSGDLGAEFGNFENGKNLFIFHLVADVDVNVPDVPGNLGVNVNLLVGTERSGESDRAANRATSREGHGYGRKIRIFAAGLGAVIGKFE